MDVATTIDNATTGQLLLSMPYEEVIMMIQSHPKYYKAVDDTFWFLKLQKDYQKIYDPTSSKSPQEQYFAVHDLIREDDALNDIFWRRLKAIEESSKDEVKVHFSGEFDSNQTKFEKLSNQLKLGVVARSKLFARATLRLLRFQVDNNPLYDYAQELMDGEPLTYTNLIKTLADQESQYGKAYPLGITFTVKYCGGETLTRDITDIDLWTLRRMEKGLEIDIVDLELAE